MTEAKKKKQWPKYEASVTHYFLSGMEDPKKGKTNLKKSCQSIYFILKTDLLHLKIMWMEVLVCENNLSGTSSPFIVTDCVGKLITGINIAGQRV